MALPTESAAPTIVRSCGSIAELQAISAGWVNAGHYRDTWPKPVQVAFDETYARLLRGAR